MTTITSVRPTNVMYTGEINVGNGQIGKFTTFTISSSVMTLVPEYYDTYYCEDVSALTEIRLPIIGNSGNNVRVGWKPTFMFLLTVVPTDTTTNPNFIDFKDSTGTTLLYRFNLLNYSFTGSRLSINNITITALAAPSTWDFAIYNASALNQSVGIVNYFNNGASMQLSLKTPGTLLANNVAANINVLIATPVILSFSYNPQYADQRFLAYTVAGTTTSFTTVVSGVYLIEASLQLSVTGGGTTTNVIMQVRRNGIQVPASFVAVSTLSGLRSYMLRCNVALTTGDLLSFACGKSVVSAGTTTLNIILFTIKYIG